MRRLTQSPQGPLALILALAVVVLTPGISAALPTSDFTFGPTAPEVAEPVTFTFTGSCDVPPCRIQWRWFKDGGSHLGSSMGEGEVVDHAFTTPGTYSVVARITNATTTHGSAAATHALVVSDTVQDDDRRISFGPWRGAESVGATHGGHHLSRAPGSAATLRFTGRTVTYVARTGPDEGIARVLVDGRELRRVNLYAAAPGTRSRTVTGLRAGAHRVVVRPTGSRVAASSGTSISLDEFVVGAVRVDDASARVSYDTWAGRRLADADGGTLRVSGAAGAGVGLSFTGTSLTWVTAKGPDQGIARVVIDGRTVATVDNHASAYTSRVARTYAGLGPGRHVVRVVALGRHSTASTASRVVVDAFIAR